MLWSENSGLIDCLLMVCVFLWGISGMVQLYFYLSYFLPFARFRKPIREPVSAVNIKPVSLILAAKNEATNLVNNLPFLLQQTAVEFELIVVNDHSSDATAAVLESFEEEQLQVFNLKENFGKKAAIELGISKASHDLLVFTDADCRPKSEQWLAIMSSNFSSKNQIVLGHSCFYKSKGILNRLQRFENLMVATQYFSFALKGNTFMGVGRNLAYTKEIFIRSNSFKTHKNLRSGDDDLLVNEMATSTNVAIEFNNKSHTMSEANKSWSAYVHQKRRQMQAGEQYRTKHKLQLAALGGSTLLFNILTLILLYFSKNWPIILMTFGLILIIKSVIIYKVSKKLGEKDLVPWFWLLETTWIISQTIIGVSTWIWRVNRWK